VTNLPHPADQSSAKLDAVRDIFVKEAISAPQLFSDLAQMEQYIAESYKTRSFIELIQNADDANAKRFGIHQIGADLAVGNDGHVFTSSDVEALCRSGSSQKKRGLNTIGYRGIGFKSVVNIAHRIVVLSGEYAFAFDREEVKRQFTGLGKVPLIRIPIVLSQQEAATARARIAQIQDKYSYSTVFLFELGESRRIADELSAIRRHSFLFLRSVEQIEIALGDHERTIQIGRAIVAGHEETSVHDGEAKDVWLLHRHRESFCDVVAFKYQEGEVVSAEADVSVLHSFLPTNESAGALLKINGDYTTDPSRKAIDLDEQSQLSFGRAAAIIAEALKGCIEGKQTPGIFRPLTMDCSPGRFKLLLHDLLAKYFDHKAILINGRMQLIRGLRIRPDWLNYEDYEVLCRDQSCQLGRDLVSRIPELPVFLERFGVPKLSLTEALDYMEVSAPSSLGAAQIVARAAKQYRYDLTAERLSTLQQISLFPLHGTLTKASEIQSLDSLDQEFLKYLSDAVPAEDLEPFLRKMGIASAISNSIPPGASEGTFDRSPSPPMGPPTISQNLTRWRSAEKNAEEYFRGLPGVLAVSDVSVANMGYDLEVSYNGGNRLFVEVKSVKSFTESIKITNNEYASAHKYGALYCLAIVINADKFELMVVRDPIRALLFQKQIERWSWLCDSYTNELEFPLNLNVGSEVK
jgi:hypothetical protein